jgi:predicted NodU family carbamoyl transferase
MTILYLVQIAIHTCCRLRFCKENANNLAPAIVHIDNTERVQTLNKKNGYSFLILKEFEKITI